MNAEDKVKNTYTELYASLKNAVPGILVETECDVKNILPFFVKEWYPHMNAVSLCDKSYFTDKKVCLFPNHDIMEIMKKLTPENQNIVWQYLHSLYALSISTKYVKEQITNRKDTDLSGTDYENILPAVNNFQIIIANIISKRTEMREQVSENTDGKREENITSGIFGMMEMLEKMINTDKYPTIKKLIPVLKGIGERTQNTKLFKFVLDKVTSGIEPSSFMILVMEIMNNQEAKEDFENLCKEVEKDLVEKGIDKKELADEVYNAVTVEDSPVQEILKKAGLNNIQGFMKILKSNGQNSAQSLQAMTSTVLSMIQNQSSSSSGTADIMSMVSQFMTINNNPDMMNMVNQMFGGETNNSRDTIASGSLRARRRKIKRKMEKLKKRMGKSSKKEE